MIAAYSEFIDFLVENMTPEKVLAFQASPELKDRVAELVHKQKTTGLSRVETAELEQYVGLETLMGAAKARARRKLLVDVETCP